VILRAATFSSLHVRNLRLYFVGQMASGIGVAMQTVAQSFLVLRLTDSGTMLGLTTAAQFGPVFVFGPWAGVLVDRADKRRLIFMTQSVAGLLALALGVLVGTGQIRLSMVFVLVTALGVVTAIDVPARQAFMAEAVGEDQLQNAVALNNINLNVSRMLGGAVAGVVVATLGLPAGFDINAATYGFVLVMLARMRKSELRPTEPAGREPGQVREGLRYASRTPELAIPLVMVAVAGALAWEFPVSLPLLAHSTFGGGATMYAVMTVTLGLGSVLGGVVAASRQSTAVRGLALGAIGWGLAIVLAAVCPNATTSCIALVLVGYGSISFNSVAKTTLQLSSSPQMRGRVMALWALAWQGTTPLGGPIVGWAGQGLGGRWALLVGGIPTALMGFIALPVLGRLDAARESRRSAADSTVDVID
jgi:MFS family permease